MAKMITNTIDPHPDAPDGSVTTLSSYTKADFAPTDAILCRLNAPLIAFAFELIKRGVACHLANRRGNEGSLDVALGRLLDKITEPTYSIEDCKNSLHNYNLKETEKLCRKGKRAEAASLTDKCSVLLLFLNQSVSVHDCHSRIRGLFANGDGVTLSTIHKAKGLEWPRVYILDRRLMPSPWAETSDELRQERNLEYVAVTRAKLDLVNINSNCWK